jgi:hypothetical protein
MILIQVYFSVFSQLNMKVGTITTQSAGHLRYKPKGFFHIDP